MPLHVIAMKFGGANQKDVVVSSYESLAKFVVSSYVYGRNIVSVYDENSHVVIRIKDMAITECDESIDREVSQEFVAIMEKLIREMTRANFLNVGRVIDESL